MDPLDVLVEGPVRLALDQVPLVDRDDEALALLDDVAGDVGVLGGETLDRVDHEDRDVGPRDCLQGAEGGVALGCRPGGDLAAPPDAGGVDQDDLAAAPLEGRVDRVAGRARDLGHDRPILPEEAVEERRLADVRAADEGDRGGLVGCRFDGDGGVPAGGHPVGLVGPVELLVVTPVGLIADDERLESARRHIAGPFVGLGLALLAGDLGLRFRRQRRGDRIEQVARPSAVRR